jgi:phage gp29-like protein
VSFFSRVSALGRGIVAAAASGAERVARAGRPRGVTVQQYQPWVTTSWTVARVLNALDLHESGDFSESAQLAAAFGRDDRISACINTRVRALLSRGSVGFSVEPSDISKLARVKELACAVQAIHWKACPEHALARILGDGVVLGVSIARIHWELDGETWRPWLEPWDMQFARWDDTKGCYVVSAREGFFDVVPGTGEWLVYEPAGKFGWMAGAVRALGLPFIFRAFDQKDWARFCEKHGSPILAVTEPNEDAKPGQKEAFYKRLRNLGREGVIRLPQDKEGKKGFSVDFIEPKDTAWKTFEAWLIRLDVNIAIHLLGQNLSTEVQGGSLAASRTQNLVRHDYMSADGEGLATCLRHYVWMPWGRFNFAWFTDDELAPWPRWNTAPPEDLTARAKQFLDAANALEKLLRAKFPVNLEKFAEIFGLPMLTPEERAKLEELAKQATPANDAKDAAA